MSLPTFEEWTKNMSLTDQIKFHYDVDLDNFTGDPWKIVGEIAEDGAAEEIENALGGVDNSEGAAERLLQRVAQLTST